MVRKGTRGVKAGVGRPTVTMRTQRSVAQATTKMPPPKRNMNPIFVHFFSWEPQSMGRGIDMRYKSVETFMAR